MTGDELQMGDATIWKALVIVARAPLALGWILILVFVSVPVLATVALLMFLGLALASPFMLMKAAVNDDREYLRNAIPGIWQEPLGILSIIGKVFMDWFAWTTLRPNPR